MSDKLALCVGNNFPGSEIELNGCQNDADDWSNLLKSAGYTVVKIHEATKAEVVAKMKEMVAKAGWGDRIVTTFSSHGTWVPDRSGDEADKRDEAIVMADYANGASGLLFDDEIEEIFAPLHWSAGSLILGDECHSGSVSRFFGPNDPTKKPRFVSPSKFTDLTEQEADDIEQWGYKSSPPRNRTSLISGCKDDEFSYDAWIGGRYNGAFTYYATSSYIPGNSLNTWYQQIAQRLAASEYDQSPQLTTQNLYRKYAKAF